MKKNWQRLQTQKKVTGKFWVLCTPYLVTDKSWSASQSIESHTTCRAHTSHRSSMQLLYLQLQNLSSQKKKKKYQTWGKAWWSQRHHHTWLYIHTSTLSRHCFPISFSLLPCSSQSKHIAFFPNQIRIKMGVLHADLMSSLQKVFLFGNNKLWMLVTCPKTKE